MVSDVEQLFVYMLAICWSSLESAYSGSLPIFYIGLFSLSSIELTEFFIYRVWQSKAYLSVGGRGHECLP